MEAGAMAMAQAVLGSAGAGLASASSHTSGSGRQQLKLKSVVSAGARKGRRQRRGLAVSAQNQEGANDGSMNAFASDIGIMNGDGVLNGDKGGGDMLKLFQDAQENMLFLNKQRLIAIEELQKVERDREFLMAKVAQVEAEFNASVAMRETLEQRLKAAEAALEMAESRGGVVAPGTKVKRLSGKSDPPSVWSNLLVRIDSMLLSGAVTVEEARSLRRLVAARDVRAAEAFEDLSEWSDEELSKLLLNFTKGSDRTLHVVQIATELAPVAQAGSLGSWMLGLCRALRRKGHTVEVILPMYQSIDRSHIECFRESPGELYSFFEDEWHRNKVYTGSVYGIPVTFIQPLHPALLFDRDRFYGHDDDFERFTYFSRAALEYCLKMDKGPDVLHLHDWHTALVAPLFWDIYHHQGMPDTRLMFTWHDAHYQNPAPAELLAKVGLDPGQLNRPDRLQDPRDAALVNLLKGGVVYSNKVTTVSAKYAEDVKSTEFGCSLEGVFQTHSSKIVGLPSGINESEWDPSRDRALPMPYSTQDDLFTAKAVARSDLRMKLGLPLLDNEDGSERPIVACLVPHLREAEMDLLKACVATVMETGGQLVFVGASRSPKVQAALEELQRETEDPNVKFVIHYEDDMAHLAMASAQILLCFTFRDPSFSFPLAGLKYGALPVSRQPRDGPQSLVDVDDQSRGAIEGVGFFVGSESPNEVAAALSRAIKHARDNHGAWEEWTRRAMSLDTSWDALSSDAYIDAYWSIYRC